jgi:hypothetical protein
LAYLNNDLTAEEDVDAPGTFLQMLIATRIEDLQKEGRARQVFTVGFDDGERTWWGWVRAHTEPELKALFPELFVRHGRDDEWLAATRANGSFDETVSDIAEPASGLLQRVWTERRSDGSKSARTHTSSAFGRLGKVARWGLNSAPSGTVSGDRS